MIAPDSRAGAGQGRKIPWPAPFRHPSLPSTSLTAAELARAGAAHGTAVTADEQTGGRGRLGRLWVSPPGNLYVSYVLRPAVAPTRAAQIGFVAALAVADALDAWLPDRARLKWPNDVLVDGAKISGILAERGDAHGFWIVLGIGLNVGFAPAGLAYPATCVTDHAQGVTTQTALATLSAALQQRCSLWECEGFASIRADWRRRAHPPGTELHVTLGAEILACRYVDLAADGALLVETASGAQRIVSGDVTLATVKAPPADV